VAGEIVLTLRVVVLMTCSAHLKVSEFVKDSEKKTKSFMATGRINWLKSTDLT
jgi:hypothetical protein